MAYDKELIAAVEAVVKACTLCRNVASSLISEDSMSKNDRSPVTVADYGAQAVVLSELLATPVAGKKPLFVAEEDAGALLNAENGELYEKVIKHVQAVKPDMTEAQIIDMIQSGDFQGGESDSFWTLDPIDGTKGFLRSEQYAVALALIERGQVVLGVLGCPNLSSDHNNNSSGRGSLFFAVKGQGAYQQALPGKDDIVNLRFDNKITVSGDGDISQASFCESVESGHSSHDDSAKIASLLGVTADPVRMDSQCKYAAVGRGQASIYLRLPTSKSYEEKIWDHAAGSIIVEEAGGKVSDITGKPLIFSRGRTLKANRGVVAAAGQHFPEVIKAVREVLQC